MVRFCVDCLILPMLSDEKREEAKKGGQMRILAGEQSLECRAILLFGSLAFD